MDKEKLDEQIAKTADAIPRTIAITASALIIYIAEQNGHLADINLLWAVALLLIGGGSTGIIKLIEMWRK